MGGFFGAVSHEDVVLDVFFGTDYHSHLGTRNAGMAVWSAQTGTRREIHSIENTPFRTRFEADLPDFAGTTGIGCISDADPQPLLVQASFGYFTLGTVGVVNNADALIRHHFDVAGRHFMAMGSGKVNMTELVASLICEGEDLLSGIKHAAALIQGSMSMVIIDEDGSLVVARDVRGRTPVQVGKREGAMCVSFETFAYQKLGYADAYSLGPAEIVRITADGMEVLSPATDDLKICAFLWSYYGYPNSSYEGINVEVMRYRNGQIMARDEAAAGTLPTVDYVAGVPDSGIPHAIGYANVCHADFARPFVKYTPTWPRSFMPTDQNVRAMVAKMKQIPVPELIEGKRLLFVDDSIVRGTQLRETVDFLYENGAAEVHMRSACPPIMYACKYLNFSRGNSDMDLLARRTVQELEGDEGANHLSEYADAATERGKGMRQCICKQMGFESLGYQSLDGLIEAIGLPREHVCTYCWTGEE